MPEQIVPLPIRVRPRPGELADSYVCRLARANHLKPSYLHALVNGPPYWAGTPKIGRLALYSGIPKADLERALSMVATSLIDVRLSEGQTIEEHAQQRLFFRIRRYAEGRGLPLRMLAERHHTSRRTVRRALSAPEPPPDKLVRRSPARTQPLTPIINPMLEEGLTSKQIWVRLIDEHDIVLRFDRVGNYAKEWHLTRNHVEPPAPTPVPPPNRRA